MYVATMRHSPRFCVICVPRPQFHTLALSVQEAAQEQWKGLIDATVGISELVTAETEAQTWPFVILRNWDLYVKTEASPVSDFIAVCPLVLQAESCDPGATNQHDGQITKVCPALPAKIFLFFRSANHPI